MKIVDLHCDTISSLQKNGQSLYDNSCHCDIKRARKAGVGLQIFALFTMPQGMNESLRQILKQIEKFYSELDKYQDYLQPVFTYEDIIAAANTDKIACILHLEGADALGSDSEILSLLYRMGLRSLGLTWNNRNLLADGVGEEGGGGISNKGKEIIYLMENLGIMLDLSHVAIRSYYDALNLYNKPVLVSHANARALCNHRRNLDDAQLKALAENGGVIGINQVPEFIKEDGKPELNNLLDHLAYISDLIGVEHVALGSDFDGADVLLMQGVEEYSRWPQILAGRGFTPAETAMILSENALRVIKAVLGSEE
ncbi:MAG: dipeptidase [Syntrophomonadaceae bacterium]